MKRYRWLLGFLGAGVIAIGACAPLEQARETVVLVKPTPANICQNIPPIYPGCSCPPGCYMGDSTTMPKHVGITLSSPPMNGNDPLLLPDSLSAYQFLPQYSGSDWPISMTLTLFVDTNGTHLGSRVITLTLKAIDSAGTQSDAPFGHMHNGGSLGLAKPKGSLSSSSVTTDASTHLATVTYTASKFSGPVIIFAASSGADTARLRVNVGVKDLVRVDSTNKMMWIGYTNQHPSGVSHYATDSMKAMLLAASDSIAAIFGGKVFPLNDMSLPWGGRFDWDSTKLWTAGHLEHGGGRSADVRTQGTNALTRPQLGWLKGFWTDSLDSCIFPEKGPPHWHLRQSRDHSRKCP